MRSARELTARILLLVSAVGALTAFLGLFLIRRFASVAPRVAGDGAVIAVGRPGNERYFTLEQFAASYGLVTGAVLVTAACILLLWILHRSAHR